MKRRLFSLVLVFVTLVAMVVPCFAGDAFNGSSHKTESGAIVWNGSPFSVPAHAVDVIEYGMRLTSYQVDEKGDIIPGSIRHLNVVGNKKTLDYIDVYSATSHSVIDYCQRVNAGDKYLTWDDMGFTEVTRSNPLNSTWIPADLDGVTEKQFEQATGSFGEAASGDASQGEFTDSAKDIFVEYLGSLVTTWSADAVLDEDKWGRLLVEMQNFAKSSTSTSSYLRAIQDFIGGYVAEDSSDAPSDTNRFYMIGEPMCAIRSADGVGFYTLNELYNLAHTTWAHFAGHYVEKVEDGVLVTKEIGATLGIGTVFKNLAKIGHLDIPFSEAYGANGEPVPTWTDLGNGKYFGEFSAKPPYAGTATDLINSHITTSAILRYSGVIDFTHVVPYESEGDGYTCSMYYTLVPRADGLGFELQYMNTEVEDVAYTSHLVRYGSESSWVWREFKFLDVPVVGTYRGSSTSGEYKIILNDITSGALLGDVDGRRELAGTTWEVSESNFSLPSTYTSVVDLDYGTCGGSGSYPVVLGMAASEASLSTEDTAKLSMLSEFDVSIDSYFSTMMSRLEGMGLYAPYSSYRASVLSGLKSRGISNLKPYFVFGESGYSSFSLDYYAFAYLDDLYTQEEVAAKQVYFLRYICVPTQYQHNFVEVHNSAGAVTGFFHVDNIGLGYNASTGVLDVNTVDSSLLLSLGIPLTALQTLDLKSVVSMLEVSDTYTDYDTLREDGDVQAFNGTLLDGYSVDNWPVAGIPYEAACVWTVTVPDSVPSIPPVYLTDSAIVPQWRLSRYLPKVAENILLSMVLSPVYDSICHVFDKPSLTNAGTYEYNVVYPDGALYSPVVADEQTRILSNNKWLQFRVKSAVLTTPVLNSPSTSAKVNSAVDLLLVKTTADSQIFAANWANDGSVVSTLATNYEVSSSNVPGVPTLSFYDREGKDLEWNTKKITEYCNHYGQYWHTYSWNGESLVGSCRCYEASQVPNATYTGAFMDYTGTFSRYISSLSSSKLFDPQVVNTSTKSTLRYEYEGGPLKLYPEYGLLFDSNKDVESIVWAVGDTQRKINSYIYQTMQYKVYVSPVVSGTSVATDSRAITRATQLGYSKLPIIYKGAGVSSMYRLTSASSSAASALLTVKTYALDFKSGGTYQALKSAWGNSGYDPGEKHKSLYSTLSSSNKADVESKLLIASSGSMLNYTGGTSRGTVKFTPVSYSGHAKKDSTETAVVFEHELIIRNGLVIGVKYMSHSSPYGVTSLTMAELKENDDALYEAIVQMGLYSAEGTAAGTNSNTVLSVLERNTGNALDRADSVYASLLQAARASKDGLTSVVASPTVDKGWYGEDTTVLSVYEYISNFTVPGTSVSDKISATVKGLDTPADKSKFFSTMYYGHLYLRYGLDVELTSLSSSLVDKSPLDVYFEYSSYRGGSYGRSEYTNGAVGPFYLVPNVGVTDTTRLS